MKIAYIIHAYKYPEQVGRLIKALTSPNASFFIHIDKKVNINPFVDIISKTHTNNINWVDREYSNWGTMGCVQAVLNALTQAMNSEIKFEYFYFLSGQDYPIKSKQCIENTFRTNRNKEFIQYRTFPNKDWKGGGVSRFNRYHFIISKKRSMKRLDNLISYFLPRRKFPYDLEPYNGSFYFGLSCNTVKYVLDFIRTHPKYTTFHRHTDIPEELFFQTIILNASDKIIAENVINKSLTYVDWTKPKGPYPAILTSNDYEMIIKSDCLFARKFDMYEDAKLFEMIDKYIREPG